MNTIEEKIRALTPGLRQEVEMFIDSLLEKEVGGREKGRFTFSWAGALRDLRDQYTSVELQHKITQEW
jgi:hypothetical protein